MSLAFGTLGVRVSEKEIRLILVGRTCRQPGINGIFVYGNGVERVMCTPEGSNQCADKGV